jgi:thiamine-monophosphate kinase
LRSIAPYLDSHSHDLLVAAPDDDAAVWRGDPVVVATTDTMVEEIDFRLGWPEFDFRTLGRRLISINLSDLAAMGAEPRYALVSLCLRGVLPVADVRKLYRGIAEQARRFGVTIAGGDLSGTLGSLTLGATLIGRLPSARQAMRRRGARPGWTIAVTGALGGAAAGLRVLESGRSPANANQRGWVSALLDPQPRVAAGRALVQAGITVGGDISDGLAGEVERLVEARRPGTSGAAASLGATIEIDSLPLAHGIDRAEWRLAASDSEDFELICAGPLTRIAAAQRTLHALGVRLTVIGRFDERPGIRWRQGGLEERLDGAGYEHFR